MLYGIWSKIKELINRLDGNQETNDDLPVPTHETYENSSHHIHLDRGPQVPLCETHKARESHFISIDHAPNGMFDDSGLTVKDVESCWREGDNCCTDEMSKDTCEDSLMTESFAMAPATWNSLENESVLEEQELVVTEKPAKKKSSKKTAKKATKKATKSEKKVAKEKAVKKSKKNKK